MDARISSPSPLSRRFKICSICLLIVVVSASILFIAHLARQVPEPFVSIRFALTNVSGTQAHSLDVSNRMSFNVDYLIDTTEGATVMQPNAFFFGSRFRYSSSLGAHSQKREIISSFSDQATAQVSYERQLKPFEVSVLKTFPWLKRYYPFHHRRSFPIYKLGQRTEKLPNWTGLKEE